MSTEKSSPIPTPVRRQAGQSLREWLAVERDGFVFYAGGITVSSVMLVGVVWLAWFRFRPLTPWLVTGAAAVLIVILALDVRSRLRSASSRAKGLRGELFTAEWLDDLTRAGYTVFHDLQGDRGNIDHLAVGPAGVLVIETKFRSKPPGAKVVYDGRRLLVGEFDATDAHLGQARACRDDVRRRLRERSPQAGAVPVRAVLTYPGWDVQECSGTEVWVLNPKRRIAAWAAQEERREGRVASEHMAAAIAVLDEWARRP
ncbi:MAG TPA: nuclease-related domain-containing protein [Phycisphaerales bacterium]|nr:nuclease-related domain-containing protein [Phycisphaerales bacterium]